MTANNNDSNKLPLILEKLGLIGFARQIRNIYYKILIQPNYWGQNASDKIFECLISNKPVMICRFGRIEISSMIEVEKILKGKSQYYEEKFVPLKSNAGFFPIDYNNLKKFYQRMIEDINFIDILGIWCPEELNYKEKLNKVTKIELKDLEPYYHDSPWTRALKGKKVLVIHPFAKTIKSQYKIRKKLFENKWILPDFELITLKAVQTIGGESNEFSSWFEALKYMENKINKIDFDIAIIGCGAYGFPLAAHVKRIGKKAIHLGGSTQLLFGIKGKRWEEQGFPFINKYWVRPREEEKPKTYKKVEEGCYW